jgi:NADH-quinone oxidoreductase subunit G
LKGLDGKKIAALAGDLCDAESMFALKEVMTSLGAAISIAARTAPRSIRRSAPPISSTHDRRHREGRRDPADRHQPALGSADGQCPHPQALSQGRLKVAAIGPKIDLTYPVDVLGAGADTLGQIASGSHAFAQVLKDAKAPMLIVGMGALARPDGAAILAQAKAVADCCGLIKDGWNGFNVLQTAAGRVAGLELGFVPAQGGRDITGILDGARKGEIEFLYLLGADEIDPSHFGKAFVVYQAIMAIAARTAPMSCCPVPPIPRRTAPT